MDPQHHRTFFILLGGFLGGISLPRCSDSVGQSKNSWTRVNMKKRNLCKNLLKFLGHIVSSEGISVDLDKTKDFPGPTTLKALQLFFGMAGWYHRCIPNFSLVAEPLFALKRKGANECQTSFEILKRHLTISPISNHPNSDCLLLFALMLRMLGCVQSLYNRLKLELKRSSHLLVEL